MSSSDPTRCSTWLKDEIDFKIHQSEVDKSLNKEEIDGLLISAEDPLIEIFSSGSGTIGLGELQVESQYLSPLVEEGRRVRR